MQQTTGVAVLATHLADTDRRALSQAWYSALHLAGRAPVSPRPPLRAAPPLRAPERAPNGAPPSPGGAALERSASTAARTLAARRIDLAGAADRRGPSELARRIERALTQHVPRAPRGGAASFTVRAGSGSERVHVIVRSDGVRTRVVAVCAPPLRERVERALAQVRFALAGSGVRAEVA